MDPAKLVIETTSFVARIAAVTAVWATSHRCGQIGGSQVLPLVAHPAQGLQS